MTLTMYTFTKLLILITLPVGRTLCPRGSCERLHQMSTTQLGALDRIVSDITFAPDCPIPFPCKLWNMKGLLKRATTASFSQRKETGSTILDMASRSSSALMWLHGGCVIHSGGPCISHLTSYLVHHNTDTKVQEARVNYTYTLHHLRTGDLVEQHWAPEAFKSQLRLRNQSHWYSKNLKIKGNFERFLNNVLLKQPKTKLCELCVNSSLNFSFHIGDQQDNDDIIEQLDY